MFTLTSTAIFSKKASRLALLAVFVLITTILFFKFGANIKKSLFPPPPVPATVAFGKLPKNELSGIPAAPGQEYVIQTVSGDLTFLGTKVKVFKVGGEEASFGILERARVGAKSLKFNGEPEIAGNELRFLASDKIFRTLVADTTNGSIRLESDYLSNPHVTENFVWDFKNGIEVAKSFLRAFGFDLAEFPDSKIKTILYKIENGNLTVVDKPVEANLALVNFYRADIDKMPVVSTADLPNNMSLITSATDVVDAKVRSFKVERHRFATYPLKTTAEAFEDLKSGKAQLNSEVSPEAYQTPGGPIVITKVSLGYLEPQEKDKYLQPVYIFEGLGNFKAFVNAVSQDWTF